MAFCQRLDVLRAVEMSKRDLQWNRHGVYSDLGKGKMVSAPAREHLGNAPGLADLGRSGEVGVKRRFHYSSANPTRRCTRGALRAKRGSLIRFNCSSEDHSARIRAHSSRISSTVGV
jgi:hypothetical protein